MKIIQKLCPKYLNILIQKIKSSFIKDFDMACNSMITHEDIMKKMQDKCYEYDNLISELDRNFEKLLSEKIHLEEVHSEIKNEYEYLKESYDDLVKENSELRRENEKKTQIISSLERDLSDMKNVIGKLTEVRVTLNKYFSSHFENFT
jgi:chromosome segregation ATPase